MGRHQVNFKCHHCSHCCTDVVCLPTPWDVLRIAVNTGENPYDFIEFIKPDEITGVEKGDPTWLKIGGEKYMMALKRTAKSGCYFLTPKTYYCRIYDHRPNLCRLYPFKLHESRDGKLKGFSLHKDVGCKRHRDSVYETAPLYEIYKNDSMHQADYVKMVKAFNKQRKLDRKPEDFLAMFIEVVVEG